MPAWPERSMLATPTPTADASGRGSAESSALNSVRLSRHTWAQALDTNTVSNCQGCVPQMDCRVVRIFRAHNFAWGGNFLNPDGMHFEWVGEPRNTYLYPSRYCPNVPGGGLQSFGLALSEGGQDSRGTMFADDGWALAGD